MGQESSQLDNLKPARISDLQEVTKFSPAEIRDWYHEFIRMCPDGYITVADFRRLYTNLFPAGDVISFTQHVFRTFDSSADGRIDLRELLCALCVTSRGTVEEKLEWAFALYDVEEYGLISKSDMLEIVKVSSSVNAEISEIFRLYS